MKITRNGVEIELTAEEMRFAYDEYILNCRIEDIKSVIDQYPEYPETSDEQLHYLADEVDSALSKNDIYYEAYWQTIDYVLDFEKEGIAAENKANRDYEIIPEGIITKFNTLKKRELQLEYLVSAGIIGKDEMPDTKEMIRLFPKKEWSFSKESFDLLCDCCDNCIKVLTAAIPQNFLDDWERCDTERYTQLNYRGLFWNEIELPVLTNIHFEAFKSIVECELDRENIGACIALYDMSGGILEFDSLQETEAFIGHVHCEPATVFEAIVDADSQIEGYREAYSI